MSEPRVLRGSDAMELLLDIRLDGIMTGYASAILHLLGDRPGAGEATGRALGLRIVTRTIARLPLGADRHGGPPVAQHEPITDPKITGWLYGDEPTLLDALTDMEAAS